VRRSGRAAIKGAKGVGRLALLINDQTIPSIMGKMPYTDWKEWATRRPEWMQENWVPLSRNSYNGNGRTP
jgi:hypothetical protein